MYPSQSLVFDELFDRAAEQGRGDALFGFSEFPSAYKEQALKACFGAALPEYYFEFPLMGDPWLDMLVLYDMNMLGKRASFDGDAFGHAGFFREAYEWGLPKLSLGMEFDFSRDGGATPGLYLSKASDARVIARMMEHVGAAPKRGEAVLRVFGSAPKTWRRYYIGAMPGRQDAPVRLGFTVPTATVQAYCQDPQLLRSDLQAAGFTRLSEKMLAFLGEAARLGQMWDIQIDVLQDCTIGPTLGVSFMLIEKKISQTAESFQAGKARALMEQFERYGLADSRWKRIPEALFVKPLYYGEDQAVKTLGLICRANFAKVKWMDGAASPAKFYLAAKGYDIDIE